MMNWRVPGFLLVIIVFFAVGCHRQAYRQQDEESVSPEIRAPVNENAIVAVVVQHANQRLLANGFVCGDGTLVAAPWHMIVEWSKVGNHRSVAGLTVLSRYYGDIFEATLAAGGPDSGVAILKLPWSSHPALDLADPGEIRRAEGLSIIGRDFRPFNLSLPEPIPLSIVAGPVDAIWMEKNEAIRILLDIAQEVVGQSAGAPVIVRGGKRIAGLLTGVREVDQFRKPCVVASAGVIQELISRAESEPAVPVPDTRISTPDEHSAEAFRAALLSLAATGAKKNDLAASAADEYVRLRPDSPYAHLDQGLVCYVRGEKESAVTSIRKAALLRPESSTIHENLALSLGNLGRKEEALEEYRKAWTLATNGPRRFLLNMVTLLVHSGNVEEAEGVVRDAAEREPLNADSWFTLGWVLLAQRREEKALEAISWGFELKPEMAEDPEYVAYWAGHLGVAPGDITPATPPDPLIGREDGEPLHPGFIPGFDDRAIVVVTTGIPGETGGVGNGFVIEGGEFVVTVAHAVVETSEEGRHSMDLRPRIISRHFGGEFAGEVVGIDREADLALVRPNWPEHPSLELGGTDEILAATNLVIAGYGRTLIADGLPRLDSERLPVFRVQLSDGEPRKVMLGEAEKVGKGWSGAPILNASSGRALGVFASLPRTLGYRSRRPLGGTANRIEALLNSVEDPAAPCFGALPGTIGVESAEETFTAILETVAAFKQEDNERGVAEAREVVHLRPRAPWAHILLATAASFAGEKDLVAEESAEAAALAPDDPYVIFNRAKFLDMSGKTEEARQEYLRALERCPDDVLTLCYLIGACLQTGRVKDALELGRDAVERYPDNAYLWAVYGNAHMVSGDRDKGIGALSHALELRPEFSGVARFLESHREQSRMPAEEEDKGP